MGWGLGAVRNLPGGEVDNQKSRSRRTTFFEEFPRAQNAMLCRGVRPAAEEMVSKTTSIPLKRRELGRFAPDRSRVRSTRSPSAGGGFFCSLPIPDRVVAERVSA